VRREWMAAFAGIIRFVHHRHRIYCNAAWTV
jgi:hypothetical protein